MMDFGGTSAATPLAAGVGALVISANPDLPLKDVRLIMRKSCDKIGGVTYSGGAAGAEEVSGAGLGVRGCGQRFYRQHNQAQQYPATQAGIKRERK